MSLGLYFAIAGSLWLGFTVCASNYDKIAGLWTRKHPSSTMAKLVIDMLDQPGWDERYGLVHSTGLRVHPEGYVYLPNGSSAELNDYWRHRVKDAFVARAEAIKNREREQGERQLGENIIAFAEKVRRI